MTNQNKALAFTFFSGFETFHTLIHAYFGVSAAEIVGHPAELLGFTVNPTFHVFGTLINAAIAIGLAFLAHRALRKGGLNTRSASQRLQARGSTLGV
jgi:hypothetical protein